jgi:pimeloyl-ACP methyl ester carboxylesterase
LASLVYLHGFASGPRGAKGEHCRNWAEARGIPFQAPDLNLPDFEHLTVSAQVEAVEELLRSLKAPPVVVGSSLGGMVAAAVAHRGAALRSLILLAPALGFAHRRLEDPRWAGYRRRGSMPTFHFARNAWTRLGPELLADLPRWADDDRWRLEVPVAILHGSRDESVPLEASRTFTDRNPRAVLTVVDDDHALLAERTLEVLDGLLEGALGPRK